MSAKRSERPLTGARLGSLTEPLAHPLSTHACQLCRFNVFDLSAMTEAEATELVEETEERLCVRFYRRADGTVVTSDCTPLRFAAARRAARRSVAVAAGLLAALLTFVLGLAGLLALRLGPEEAGVAVASKLEVVAKGMVPVLVTTHEEPDPDRPRRVMGRMRSPR